MLKTRVITALVLLAVLVPVLFSGSPLAFTAVSALFVMAAMWENQRLFNKPAGLMIAVIWTAVFVFLSVRQAPFSLPMLFFVCSAFWLLGLVPCLRFGLPATTSFQSGLISGIYAVGIFGCFIAMQYLYLKSPAMLLSVLALVWAADIGAYFFGRAFGRRKLAVTISPGKSWEGAIGGAVSVLLFAFACRFVPALADTFPALLAKHENEVFFVGILLLISAASVVGDLFESLLKRRVGMKDSSHLLPGHGGVLDRIDALIPVLPLVALLVSRW